LYGYIIICLLRELLIDVLVVSSIGPCVIICVQVYGHMHSLLLGKYLGVQSLTHMLDVCLTFKKLPNFSKVVALFYTPSSSF
jgi:hypothetical protein